MTVDRDTTAAGRVQTYLESRVHYARDPETPIAEIGYGSPSHRAALKEADLREVLAELDAAKRQLGAARRELAWHHPETINTATGAPHHITLATNGTLTIRHNLGCHRNGGRRETPTGELICQIDTYLDQTDADEHPEPGAYWVVVDVFGRSEDSVEAEWTPQAATRCLAESQRRLAEELEELPEICRHLVGPRCGEAVDRALEARRLVGEWTDTGNPTQPR